MLEKLKYSNNVLKLRESIVCLTYVTYGGNSGASSCSDWVYALEVTYCL
jgi:hypothetical protein